jgi:predicted RNase H-like nuclease
MPMIATAGIDGCKGGWLAIEADAEGVSTSHVITSLEKYLTSPNAPTLVAIDIPIGLTDTGHRNCDKLVRAQIKPRHNSVFPAPIRPALRAATRLEAAEIGLAVHGKAVSAQAFGIYKKIQEVDDLLAKHPDLRNKVFEIHPELSFAAMNPTGVLQPMRHPKMSGQGFMERMTALGHLANAFQTIRTRHPRSTVADDDILDALAALWTAHRIQKQTARRIPEHDDIDSCGIPMRMWY